MENSAHTAEILLISNFPPDGQESMLRFADVLEKNLGTSFIVRRIFPESCFSKFVSVSSRAFKWVAYLDKYLVFSMRLRQEVRRIQRDRGRRCIPHVCDHSNAIYCGYFHGVPHLVNCHDLLAIRSALGEFPENRTSWSGRKLQRWILDGINKAHHVVCISNTTRVDLLRLSKLQARQVDLVYMGLNYPYQPLLPVESWQRLRRMPDLSLLWTGEIMNPFLLHVGNNAWYKNRLGVLKIFQRVREKHANSCCLVMVGKEPTADLLSFIKRHHLESVVCFVNACANEDLQALYSVARLLLFPSLAEGFGWPVIEAQACGCPVVASNRPPMTEIGGDAAVYISPDHLDEACDGVGQLLRENENERSMRVAAGLRNAGQYSTQRMVEGYTRLYRQILETNGPV